MSSRLALLGTLAIAASLASPARAQVAGQYSGSTQDGNTIKFDVTQDSGATTFSITSASIGFSATCRGSSQTLDTGWGFGLSTPIVGGEAILNIDTDYYSFVGAVFFNGKNMHGNIVSRSPALNHASSPPNGALFCTSPKQTFTGSMVTSASTPAKPAAVSAYMYDRKGRVIGVITPH